MAEFGILLASSRTNLVARRWQMSARNVARAVVLEPQQRAQLQSLSTSRSLPHALVTRARVILMAAEGVENIEIAERVGLSRLSVGKWRQRFAQYGVEGLHDELRPGRPRTIEDERIAKLIKQTLHSQPKNATHWTTRLSAKHAKISKSTVQRIWNVFGLRPHRHRAFKLSNDPFFVEKVRDIVGLYLNPPQNALVLCVDEKSQCQALERTQPVLPMGLGYVEGITHDYVRHGTTTLFAALNIASGEVIGKCQRQHRHQEFLRFLNHIDTNVPQTLDLHLIMDNYASHKHPKVRSWLAQHPRYHVHFTPTYSSWLNQVERWFALITQRAIRRGSFRSIKDLVSRIDQFVQHYNRNCYPFCWTATADSILAKLERLCIAISGTGH
jgi:putative transposase